MNDNKTKLNEKTELIKTAVEKNYYIIALAVVFLLEITVMNYKTWTTAFYEEIPIENVRCENGISRTGEGNTIQVSGDSGYIYFDEINRHIKNIYIDLSPAKILEERRGEDVKENANNSRFSVKLDLNDESAKTGIPCNERNMNTNVERSKYLTVHTSGNTEYVKINLKNADGKKFNIDGISLNKPIPFTFSIVRIIVLYIVAVLIFAFRKTSPLWQIQYDGKSKKQFALTSVFVVAVAVIFCIMTHANLYYVYNTTAHHYQYSELADAFMKGQVSLDIEPPEALKNMDNPYDKGLRDKQMYENSSYFKWDHAYYNGKYYVYFGVLPCLVMYLPAKLLNIDFRIHYGILIIGLFFIPGVYLFMSALVGRFFKKISYWAYLLLSTMLVSCTGIFFAMNNPDLYMTPIFMGVTLVFYGLYMWIGAYDDEKEKYSKPRLFFGGLFLALTAATRPQLLLALFAGIMLFFRDIQDRKIFTKKTIPEVLSAAIPIAVVALAMMWYNYARFGSPFDFGANYNLTTNDMTRRGIVLARIPMGVYCYLFQPPVFHSIFPYVGSAFLRTNYQGIVITESTYGGIFFDFPIIASLFLIGRVKDILREKRLYISTLYLIFTGVLITLADTEMAGILYRYTLDITWPFMIAGIIVFLALCEKYENHPYLNILRRSLPIMFLFSMFIQFNAFFNMDQMPLKNTNPQLYTWVETTVQFWL